MHIAKLKWVDPITIASAIKYEMEHKNFVFLHSSRNDEFGNGNKSYIAYGKCEELTCSNFEELEKEIKKHGEKYWFGYLSYDLKNKYENVFEERLININVNNSHFISFANIIVFNHDVEEVSCQSEELEDVNYIKDLWENIPAMANEEISLQVNNFSSNMTDAQYLKNVQTVRQHIIEGRYYESNFTRKYFAEIKCTDHFAIYKSLIQKSPAQYGAYLKFGDLHVISSSPESFLKGDDLGNIRAQPIKGTIGIKSADGKKERAELLASEKDRAENLMIVDLMRNDLSRSCKIGSVKVEDLFRITSYPHLHHLSSVIIGKKRENISNIALVRDCFPPGSMTGAPKIKMMDETARLEKYKRGIYAGALGFFYGLKSFNFSVVIRTIIIKGNQLEFQVGGAIVYDSVPEIELEETKVKAMKIMEVLGLNS